MTLLLNQQKPQPIGVAGMSRRVELLQIIPYRAPSHHVGYLVLPTTLGREKLPSFWRVWFATLLADEIKRIPFSEVTRVEKGVAVTCHSLSEPKRAELYALLVSNAAMIWPYAPEELPLERRRPHELPSQITAAEWRSHPKADGEGWYAAVKKLVESGIELPRTANFYWWTSAQMYNNDLPLHDNTKLEFFRTSGTARIWTGSYAGAMLIYHHSTSVATRHELAEKVEYAFFRHFCRRKQG